MHYLPLIGDQRIILISVWWDGGGGGVGGGADSERERERERERENPQRSEVVGGG